jgi:dihydrofolate synthase/folylpolyglutamate synthase
VQNEPLTICDTGHNADGVAFIVNQLNKISTNRQLHIVWGMVKDKDRTSILKLLPNKAKYYLIKPSVQRGLEVNLLQEEMTKFGLENQAFSSIDTAYTEVKSRADLNDVIFIGGSTFVVGDFLSLELL